MLRFSRSRLNISQKLITLFLLLGIFTVVIISFVFFFAFKKALIERTSAQLSSINYLKKERIEDYLDNYISSYSESSVLKEHVDSISREVTLALVTPSGQTIPVPLDKIMQILFIRTGMGNTGESYIVGKDRRMRSMSRFFPQQFPASISVNTSSVNLAFKGAEGVHITHDYRGVKVLSAYRVISRGGLQWVMLSEIDLDEAMEPVIRIRNYIIIIGVIISIIIVIVTFFLSRKISVPIIKLKETILKVSKGILPARIPDIGTNDEIAEMGRAIEELVAGLKRTTDFAREIGGNNLNADFTPLSDQDVMGYSLLQMRDRLKVIQQKEISFVRERSAALLEGQENERQRLARELHDGLGQLLLACKLRLNLLQAEPEKVAEIKKVLDETISEVRRISNNLMPSVLWDFGLEAALRLLCTNTEKYSGIPVEFSFAETSKEPKLNFDATIGLYRIAQEGMTNILKYSKASKVRLSVLKYKEYLSMELSDNGKGFSVDKYYSDAERKEGNGIKNMTERAKLLNGSFDIESKEGQGTIITIELPL